MPPTKSKKQSATANDSQVKAVIRAATILDLFDVDQPELSMMEIRSRLAIVKSAAFRLVTTLHSVGLLDQNPENGKYRLGVALIGLGGQVVFHRDVRRVASQHLQALAEASRDTSNLAVIFGAEVMNIEQRLPPGQYVVTSGWVGRRSSLYASSTGKVLLAWLSLEEIRALLPPKLERFTPNTITDFDELLEHLARVRAAGYAVGLEEFSMGVNAVAAPVRDHTGRVTAAVSVSGPVFRITPNQLGHLSELVCGAAQAISHDLGFATPNRKVEEPPMLSLPTRPMPRGPGVEGQMR